MKTEQTPSRSSKNEDVYDFSGPLWQKYFHETRRKARFPRGFKEVFLVDHNPGRA
jgi:hypothetical protein